MAVYRGDCTVLLKHQNIETTTRVQVTVEAWKPEDAMPKLKAKAKALFKEFQAKVAKVTVDNMGFISE